MKINYKFKVDRFRENLFKYNDGLVSFLISTEEMTKKMKELGKGILSLSKLLERGQFNGYVGVSESHPYFGKGYDDVDIEIHGGLTYAREEYIDETRYWVFGWDTSHYGDTPEIWTRKSCLEENDKLVTQLHNV